MEAGLLSNLYGPVQNGNARPLVHISRWQEQTNKARMAPFSAWGRVGPGGLLTKEVASRTSQAVVPGLSRKDGREYREHDGSPDPAQGALGPGSPAGFPEPRFFRSGP